MKTLFPHSFAAVMLFISGCLCSVAGAQGFVHPGGLHTQADLDRMKSKVAAGQHPWIDGWNLLITDRRAQNTYKAAPNPKMGSRQRAQDDAAAAYLNGLRWYISGDKSHADCAVRILNSWAETVNQLPSGPDQPGLSGIPIGSFALAAEQLRSYPGWSAADQKKFKDLLVTYFYPVCSDFLKRHNGAHETNHWANWDAANILAIMAIGVYCDDRPKFEEAVSYYKEGKGMGSIRNAVPFLYPGNLGQWQESGRDQAHALGGMGLLAEVCQVAWNQKIDLFGYDNNRLLAGAEYTAQYTLWKGVPYTYYTNNSRANQFYISPNYHGRTEASHFELLYNHYVVRRRLKAPNVKLFAELKRPEPGNVDVMGYGTLTYTLDAAASPYPPSPIPPVPRDLTATAGAGQVDLQWSPSGAYTAQGYEVSRATSGNGPFDVIYSTTKFVTPAYTDTKVENGKTYYYTVAAINQSGTSARSTSASAVPVAWSSVPDGLSSIDIGKTDVLPGDTYADAANHSFGVMASGRDIGGSNDSCHFVSKAVTGDFTLTARLIDRTGTVFKAGLMMRESNDPGAPRLALTLGEIGGRQARFGIRSSAGGSTVHKPGNDYTWLPIWFRLQRAGNAFTASQSPDGISWYPVGTAEVAMAKNYLVGFAACSGDKEEQPGRVVFDNVTMAVTPPVVPGAPSGLTAKWLGGGEVELKWQNASAAGATGFKIEASSGDLPFYEIADLDGRASSFVNTGIKDPRNLRYRVRAYHIGGYSAYSNVVGR